MTLDEYRAEVIEKLKACRDLARARDLLFEVDVMLGSAGLDTRAQRTFWQALESDLARVAQDSTRHLERQAAIALGGVPGVAQAEIAHYVLLLDSEDADPPDDDGRSVD